MLEEFTKTQKYNQQQKRHKVLEKYNTNFKRVYSIEAEQAVLGGLLLKNDSWDDVVSILEEGDFFEKKHTVLFRIFHMLQIQNKPIDIITVGESIESNGNLNKIVSPDYVVKLAKDTPSAANIIAYSKIVKDHSLLRKIISVGHEMIEEAYSPQEKQAVDVLDFAEKKIFDISSKDHRHTTLSSSKSTIAETLDEIEEQCLSDGHLTGLSTGFDDLDNITSGLQKGDLIIVAGRPAMGKTTLAMNIVEQVALSNKNSSALVFSMEMPKTALMKRMFASQSRVELSKILSGKLGEDEWFKLTPAVSKLSEANIFFDTTSSITPAEIRSKARKILKDTGDLKLIVIDYLQLMKANSNHENRVIEISEISRMLKSLATELEIPIIAISQLNRELERRPNKRPMASDLRDSGAIEQDADLILMVYRDEVYNSESDDKGVAEVIIGKHRNGPVGIIKLGFEGQYSKFTNLSCWN